MFSLVTLVDLRHSFCTHEREVTSQSLLGLEISAVRGGTKETTESLGGIVRKHRAM